MVPVPESTTLAPLASYQFEPDGPRLPAIRAEVAERLRPVCAEMPDDAFELLVRDVVAFRLRWAP